MDRKTKRQPLDATVTTIRVSGWEKWQSYRSDRGTPPWIKVHRNLMTNAEWAGLTDAEKGQLVSMWIVAADKKGVLPGDAKSIKKICLLDDVPNINKFIELGFLEGKRQPLDVTVTSSCQPLDAPETETETETETDYKKTCPKFDEFQTAWEAYPLKDGRKKAQGYYKSSVKSQEDHDRLMLAMDNYKRSVEIRPRPWKNGATFFNNWTDFVKWEEPKSNGSGQNSNRYQKGRNRAVEWASNNTSTTKRLT